MSTPRHGLLVLIAAQMIVGSLAFPSQADVGNSNNVAFSAVRQNPWVPGDAFEYGDTGSIFNTGPLKVDLPRLNGNAVGTALDAISDFLGVDLPIDARLGFGGTAGGSVGFDWGYDVNGGRLNINYPAVAGVTVKTFRDPNTNQDTGYVVSNREQNRIGVLAWSNAYHTGQRCIGHSRRQRIFRANDGGRRGSALVRLVRHP